MEQTITHAAEQTMQDIRVSKLKGRKIEPKYRGPNGEEWSGRGKMARFVKEALSQGKTLEDLRIK